MFKERLFSMQRSSTKRKSFLISFLVVFLLLFFTLSIGATSLALAQSIGPDNAINSSDNLNAFATASGLPQVNLVTFIGRLVQVFLSIVGIILVLLIMYAGFIWMTAEGDPAKVDKAKKIMTNAVIGLIIIMASFAIATFIMSWLNGSTGRNATPRTPCIGCDGDLYRSAIGKGPIESVYPAPNQKDVSIDTVIVVTFKEPVTTSTIYGSDGYINSSTIQICMASSTGTCIPGSGYEAKDFSATAVSSTPDSKTYVFTPNKNLGPADGQNRYFRVTLGNGIKKLGKTESIFGTGVQAQYSWAFQTNGKMDLNPPYVVTSDIYPSADDVKDIYDNITTAATGAATSTFSGTPAISIPVKIVGKTDKYYLGQTLIVEINPDSSNSSDLGAFTAYVRSPSGPSIVATTSAGGETIKFNVSSDGTYINFSDDKVRDFLGVVYNNSVCPNELAIKRCLPFASTLNSVDLNGLIIESRESELETAKLGAPFPRGSVWQFKVYSSVLGDTFVVKKGNNLSRFMFVGSDEKRSVIIINKTENGIGVNYSYVPVQVGGSSSDTVKNLVKAINESATTNGFVTAEEVSGPSVVVRANNAGPADNISIDRIVGSTGVSMYPAPLVLSGGKNIAFGRHMDDTTKDPADPANNSKFQVTFSKPINPLSIQDNIVVRYDKNGDGEIGSDETTTASTKFANQYRTVVLTGTIPCGENSCGDQIYCWTTSTLPGAAPTSTKFEVEIKASTLRTCDTLNAPWCGSGSSDVNDSFGGTCAQNDRCQKSIGTQIVYYPKTSDLSSGITDLSNNSLNGNYNYYGIASGVNLGLSEGKSIVGSGGSGFVNPFSLPADTSLWSDKARGPWSTSGANLIGGDNFKWSFFLSSIVDLQSPLISSITPYGDQTYGTEEDQTAMDPVRISFDRVMAVDTFKPGWGYDSDKTTAEWTKRFMVLQTITNGATPVGYWIGSNNFDTDNDGWANYTQASIRHNNFDQSIQYGPLVGSGLQSITQNCFLPGNGPRFANDASFAVSMSSTPSNNCKYEDDGTSETEGCSSDLSIDASHRVQPNNPASYGNMNCANIEGAKVCDAKKDTSDKVCKVLYYQKGVTSTNKFGSWIITKDYSTATSSGKTGCCFGVCVSSSTGNIIPN